MPTSWVSAYPVEDWSAGNFTGPLTGGSTSGFIQTVGVLFRPSGETGAAGVNTWLDTLGATSLTVSVSCQSPNTASTSGWVGLLNEFDGVILGQTVDLSGGATQTVTLDTTGVDWTTVRGLNVKSGDAATAHMFTLHSSSFTGGGGAGTPVAGNCAITGSATASFVSGMIFAADIGVTGSEAVSFTGASVLPATFAVTGGTAFTTVAVGVACARFLAKDTAMLTLVPGTTQTSIFSVLGRVSALWRSTGTVDAMIAGSSTVVGSTAAINTTMASVSGAATASLVGNPVFPATFGVSASSTVSFSGAYTTFNVTTYVDEGSLDAVYVEGAENGVVIYV